MGYAGVIMVSGHSVSCDVKFEAGPSKPDDVGGI
jgi:hypothetical protein